MYAIRSYYGLHIGTVAATNLLFRASNVDRWGVSTGALYPVASAAYDIGGPSNRVDTTYTDFLNCYEINSPSDLILGRAGGTQQIIITNMSVTYFGGPPAYYQLDITIYSGGQGPFVFTETVLA